MAPSSQQKPKPQTLRLQAIRVNINKLKLEPLYPESFRKVEDDGGILWHRPRPIYSYTFSWAYLTGLGFEVVKKTVSCNSRKQTRSTAT